MRSFAIYQVIATLATMALFTLPSESDALPVRGALGNLNTRARVARRAAAHSHASPALEKRFKKATSKDVNALPVNPKQQILNKVKTVKAVDAAAKEASQKLEVRRDAGLVVDAVPSPISSPASQSNISPGANGMILGLTRPSAAIQQNIVAPAAILAAEDSTTSDSTSSEDSEAQDDSSSSESSGDAEAVYQSYVDQLNDSITATVTVTSTVAAVAPTDFKVAAVVAPQSQPAAVTPDAQAIYNSYVAQMNAAAASAS